MRASLLLFAGSAALTKAFESEIAKSYDYVIVGGGTSGLTVADRLTEDPTIKVLVIEYGDVDDGDPGVRVPGDAPPEKYFRNYQSIPQPGILNQSSTAYTGAVVGGGTVVNGMFWNRGSSADYDSWEALGNPGWGWSDLLPYFKKSETYTPASANIAKTYPVSADLQPHGTTGPVQVSFPVYQYPIVAYFYSAWKSLGVTVNAQPQDGNSQGATYCPQALDFKNQSRSSASTAHYLGAPSKRPNYHLITGHSVFKILINSSMAVTGVEYISNNKRGVTQTVSASREVILAAGALRSPGLLQMSGIGPKALLSSLGIKVLQDLPGVGYNFQDQPNYPFILSFSQTHGPTPDTLSSNAAFAQQASTEYYANRTGPLTMTYESGTTVTYLPLRNTTKNWSQIIGKARKVDLSKILPAGANDATLLDGYQAQVRHILGQYAELDTTVQETTFTGSSYNPIALLKPLSRGSVLINTTDPFADPVIDFGTYMHPTDLDIGVASVRKNREWFATPAMQELGTTEIMPGPQYSTDAEIVGQLRNITLSSWQHPSCTLSMLPRKLGGVVDPKLQVYGVSGLRIVDASIFPIIPGTHTTPIVYAVAEKAADLIKAAQ